MGDIIQVDYEALEKIAVKFNHEAEAVTQMLQALRHSMHRLKHDWMGRGSNAFFSEMEKDILPAIQRLIHALTLSGDTTKQINGLMQQADEEASSPFKNSDAGGGAGGTNGSRIEGLAGGIGDAIGGAMGAGGGGLAGGIGAAVGGAMGLWAVMILASPKTGSLA